MLTRRACLLHDDLADHAGALVGLAEVAVLASGVKLGGVALPGSVQVVVVGQSVGVHASLRDKQQQQGRDAGSWLLVEDSCDVAAWRDRACAVHPEPGDDPAADC